MFRYNVKLAVKSMRRNVILTALMIAAIAVGIGISMTTMTVYYMMNGNPIPRRACCISQSVSKHVVAFVPKSDVLFAVTLDSWSPHRPFDDDHPERAPHQLTYGDADRLLSLGEGKRQTAMFESSLIIEPVGEDELPFEAGARVARKPAPIHSSR